MIGVCDVLWCRRDPLVDSWVLGGKKIHEILLDVENVGVRDIAAKYVQSAADV